MAGAGGVSEVGVTTSVGEDSALCATAGAGVGSAFCEAAGTGRKTVLCVLGAVCSVECSTVKQPEIINAVGVSAAMRAAQVSWGYRFAW